MLRPRSIAVVLLCALAFASCVRRRDGAVTIGRREERRLLAVAARDLRCARDEVVLTPLLDRVFQAHGCGQLRDYAWSTAGRRGWFPLEPVYQRASNELACPAPQLAIAAPSATIRQATGCGRTARYDLVCGSLECAWMMTTHGGAWSGGPEGAPSAGIAPASSEPRIAVPAPPGSSAPPPLVVSTEEDEVAIPPPPSRGSPEEVLRGLLDARRAEIHGCAGAGTISVRATWDAEGAVVISLEPPLASTPAEACVQRAVMAPRVPGGAPGSIVHPVF